MAILVVTKNTFTLSRDEPSLELAILYTKVVYFTVNNIFAMSNRYKQLHQINQEQEAIILKLKLYDDFEKLSKDELNTIATMCQKVYFKDEE